MIRGIMKCCVSLLFTLCCVALAQAEPVRVLPEGFDKAQQPQMAAGEKGSVHVVFGREGAVYHVVTRDLTTFSAPVEIGRLPKLALGMRRGPRIAVSDAAVIVTAQSHEDGDVHGWSSADEGRTWKELPRLNGVAGSAREGLHALAGQGRTVVAAWLDARSGGAEIWSRVSEDGGLTWNAETRVYRSPDGRVCECCAPCLAVNGTGGIAVMWRNLLGGARDLYGSFSKDGGRTFSPAKKYGSGSWTLKACPMDGGSLAWGPGLAAPEAVWRRDTTVYLSDAVAPEITLADEAAQPLIARSGTERTLLWESHGNLMIQHGTGGAEIFAKGARAASLIALPGGGVAISWEAQGRGGPELRFAALPGEGRR